MRSLLRKSSGQSTTEFALMMPVIMVIFFYIFEVNIYWSALHHSAYASYAAARTHLVSGGPGGDYPTNNSSAQDTVDRILTGRLYEMSGPQATLSSLRGGRDGVVVNLGSLASLPYTHQFLGFNSEVSTHLGWSEFDKSKWTDPYEWECPPMGCTMVTDNNLKDYD